MTKFIWKTAIAGALAIAAVQSAAYAQDSVNIQFQPGTTGTTINGTIRGDEYIDYVLRARAGQRMDVTMRVTGTNGAGSAYFNILPAGQSYDGLFVGSNEGRTASVTIPRDGEWVIRTYLMGNDRDADRTVGFSLDVNIAGASSSSRPPSRPDLLPEEDYFIVNVATPGDYLNIRRAPSARSARIGRLATGTTVRNTGGCTISRGAQWCNVQAVDGGVRGWVAARFLMLPGPQSGNAAQLPDMVPVETAGLAGTEWRLVEFRSNSDAQGIMRPNNPENYTMRLNSDGSVNFRLDCNRGNGNWTASDGGRATSGQISFSQLAVTRAICPPPSMGETLESHTQYMRTYLVRDGMLYIDLMADGGTYVWAPNSR